MAETVPIEHDIVRTYDLLGGDATIAKPVRNSLEAHELLLSGLPASSLVFLTDTVASLAGERVLEKAIGISLRTLQRRKKDARKALLSIDQSNRTWKFAEILGRAAEVFGSREEAEAWLMRPGNRP